MSRINDPQYLKAYYPLSKDVKDYSSNGNDGTNHGVTHVSGQFGKDVGSFNGSSDYVDINNIIPDESVTVTAWVKPDSLSANNTLLGVRQADADYFWLQFNGSGKLRLFVAPGGTISTVDGVGISVGNWNFVSFVITPTTLTRYLNGNQTGTIDSGEYDLSRVTNDIYLGGRNDVPGGDVDNFFNGNISNVRIYDVALTPTEIKEIYSQEQRVAKSVPVSKPIPQSSPLIKNGLVGAWGFKNYSVLGEDVSGKGNNGVLLGNGKFDKNGRFIGDGSGSGVLLHDGTDVNPANAMTVSAWIKTTSTDYGYILAKCNDLTTPTSDNMAYRFLKNEDDGEGVNESVLRFAVTPTGNFDDGVDVFGTIDIADGKWHHVVGRYDGSTLKNYIDGVEDGSENYSSGISVESSQVTMGTRRDDSESSYSLSLDGELSGLCVYDRALSADEIKAIYKAGIPEEDLVLEVNGDGVDRSPNEHDVTLNGDVITGRHLEFDGSGDYLSSPSISFADNEITLSAWIKTSYDNTADTDNGIVGQWDYGDADRVALIYQDENNKFAILTSSDGAFESDNKVASTNTINDGSWHHVVGIHDGSSNLIYVDGVLDNSKDVDNGLYQTTEEISIGALMNSGTPNANGYFNGSMDKIKVYSRALSSDEVKEVYEKESKYF